MSKSLERFTQFQEQMVEKLEPLPKVLGLMFAGSAADLSRVDKYSDQDFYLIVENGTAESFRQDLSWLPNHDQIILSPGETEHGLKVLYQEGTMLEFAVFEIGELPSHMAPKDNRVVFDRGGVREIIDQITHHPSKPFDPKTEYQLFLTLLHIGIGRVKRGEVIAGSQHIKAFAMNHLLGLVRHYRPASVDSSDELNRYRRFERDYPALGSKLSVLIQGDSLKCAEGMLEISDEFPTSTEFAAAREVLNQLLVA